MVGMTLFSRRIAVIGLHWQHNVIDPAGFFGEMLGEAVSRSGVVERATRFHESALAAGAALHFTRFTVPEGEGELVRNTDFMRAVADAQLSFRPDALGSQPIPEMAHLVEDDRLVDNQKLSGLAGNELAERLTRQGVDTLFLTGVATNLTVEQTARHASDLGFHAHVISDCVTTNSDEAHAAALANLDLTTSGCLTAQQALDRLR